MNSLRLVLIVLLASLLFACSSEKPLSGPTTPETPAEQLSSGPPPEAPAGKPLPDEVADDAKPRVVVLYFDNNTSDPSYNVLQKGLADMMVTDLSAVPQLQILEREKLDQLIGELNLQKSSYFDPSTVQKIGKGMGAKYAVSGAIAALDPDIRLDIRLVEIATSKVVMADKVVGVGKEFFSLQKQLVDKFVAGFNLKLAAPPPAPVRDLSLLLAYSRGVDAADRGDVQTASNELAALVAQAPDFTLAKSAHEEILRRLETSRARRTELLASREASLLARADARITKGDVMLLKPADRYKHLAYLGLRSGLILRRLREVAGTDAAGAMDVSVPRDRLGDVHELSRAYYENEYRFIAERAKVSSEFGPGALPIQLELEDLTAASAMGVHQKPFHWNEHDLVFLAKHVLDGSSNALMDTMARYHPSLGEDDPSWRARAIVLLDQSTEISTQNGIGDDMSVNLIEDVGGIFYRHGLTDRAVAKWQLALDRYPQSSRFGEIEKKVRTALGMTEEEKKFAVALDSCDGLPLRAAFMAVHIQHSITAGRASPMIISRLVDRVDQACGKKDGMQIHMPMLDYQALLAAGTEANCTIAQKHYDRLVAMKSPMANNAKTVAPTCL